MSYVGIPICSTVIVHEGDVHPHCDGGELIVIKVGIGDRYLIEVRGSLGGIHWNHLTFTFPPLRNDQLWLTAASFRAVERNLL